MDAGSTSAMVALPAAYPTARCLGARSSQRLLRRVRLHNIAPLSNVGS